MVIPTVLNVEKKYIFLLQKVNRDILMDSSIRIEYIVINVRENYLNISFHLIYEMIKEKEYTVIVPKYDNSGRKIKTEIIKKYTHEFGKHFGGVTVIPSVLGCVVDKRTKKLQCEENIILMGNRDLDEYKGDEKKIKEVTEDDIKFIDRISRRIGRVLGQDSIMTTEDYVDVDFEEGKRKEELEKRKIGIDWFERLI